MGECEKCWEHLCVCGHVYRQLRPEHVKEILRAVLKVYYEQRGWDELGVRICVANFFGEATEEEIFPGRPDSG